MSTIGTTEHGAVRLVNEMGRRFREGDHAGAFDLLHPDFSIQQPESLPHGGRHDGRDGMVAASTEFARHWERSIGAARVLGCDDGSAVQITTQTWTARSTGRSATVDVVELFTVADGLIAEIRVFQQDTHVLLATLDSP
ncbi:nuclear transport factor 2 family protein [Actinomadura sp. LD22]|uniref:Nuclear transport factor 2 family protein n=1 Tax=Actinomadura physcomitrii TaxID=2650748 RepID=A0A6I4MIN1_9ACTN|nr:nuclear transport factor 2 family protein [Actinomadura physcomitrii]MWA03531.1 nuclear transport factor 2 family protein [Actinomadura physcomitrii]